MPKGVTELEDKDEELAPTALLAVIVNVYAWPATKVPVTVNGDEVPEYVSTIDGDEVIV